MEASNEQIKKSVLLLQEIWNKAFQLRVESRIQVGAEPYTPAEEMRVGIGESKFEENPHFLYSTFFSQCDWNLNTFFKVAANPEISFIDMKTNLETGDQEVSKIKISKLEIEQKTQNAIIEIEEFVNQL